MLRKLSKLFDGNLIVSGGDSHKEVKDLLVGPDDAIMTDGLFRQVAVHEKNGDIRYHVYLVGESFAIIVGGLTNQAIGPTLTLHIRETPCNDMVYYRSLNALRRLYRDDIINDMVYYAKNWRTGCVVPDGIGGKDLCRL